MNFDPIATRAVGQYLGNSDAVNVWKVISATRAAAGEEFCDCAGSIRQSTVGDTFAADSVADPIQFSPSVIGQNYGCAARRQFEMDVVRTVILVSENLDVTGRWNEGEIRQSRELVRDAEVKTANAGRKIGVEIVKFQPVILAGDRIREDFVDDESC